MASNIKKAFSSALIAGLIFLGINASMGIPLGGTASGGSGAGGDHGGADQIQRNLIAAGQTLESSPRHLLGDPVVLLGSSLVMSPLWAADVRLGHFLQDVNMHHRSLHMKEEMDKFGYHKDAVSLATPGQFVSDAYLIVDKHLKDKNRPEILIYGIAPRDFMDSTTSGLVTSVFNQLVAITDMPKIKDLFLESFDDHMNFVLERTVFLYHKRTRYQTKFEEAVEKLTCRLDKYLAPKTESAAAPFLMGTDHDAIWKQSTEEYARRYKTANEPLFQKQTKCLRALMQLCKERNIKLYIVAMPLSKTNMALMPPGLYQHYMDTLKTETGKADVPLIDLAADGNYGDDDFYDTVHLNQTGGERFIKQMTALVRANSQGIAFTPELLKNVNVESPEPVKPQLATPALTSPAL
ncbi:MAG TPA: hypothetical protein PLC15_04365 [Candidatus Obscuribacter sp.]|nr:hypothetical protein [Candidatus Obscuribacter sp.]HNH72185.1 hypothetical protein [Candidatus Obscuribacter sp.]